MFSWYIAHEIPLASRRSTTVVMLGGMWKNYARVNWTPMVKQAATYVVVPEAPEVARHRSDVTRL